MNSEPAKSGSASPVNPESGATAIGQSIPYERFLDCVHCGLCTSACPTYVETGDENNSPRGRIYLMRAVVDGRLEYTENVRHHLDLCLDCRSCETACPSGVRYGRLIEPFRVETESDSAARSGGESAAANATPGWFRRFILHGLFPHRRRLRLLLTPTRWAQKLGILRAMDAVRLTALLPGSLQRLQQQLPLLRRPLPAVPELSPATGEKRAAVDLFIGCVADAMFRHVHHATVRVLQHNGCEVRVPKAQTCCGAIHYHSGSAEPALQLMHQNADAFGAAHDPDRPLIVNVAGCGSMLKDYGHISEELADSPSAELTSLSQRVRDINEFLDESGIRVPEYPLPITAVYQDACHLQHAQRIRDAPRRLLRSIPQLTLKEVGEPELCCGAAGTYNLTQPEMAERLGNRKLDCLLAENPDVIVSANAGCSLQLQAGLKKRGLTVPVVHPIELLDLAYRGGSLSDLH